MSGGFTDLVLRHDDPTSNDEGRNLVSGIIDIPSPRGLPFLGNGLQFLGSNAVARFGAAVRATPDGLVRLRFPKSVAPVPVIVCSSAEASRELFDDDRFPKIRFTSLGGCHSEWDLLDVHP